MNILNKNSNRYDALGVYPRLILDYSNKYRFELYKYVTRGDDWDCVVSKNQFIYELNSLTYEESRQIIGYLEINGWYNHKIRYDDRIFSNRLGKFGPNDKYSFRNRNWILTEDNVYSEFPWIEVMGLGYIHSTVYVPVNMKLGGRYSYDKFVNLIDSMSIDLRLAYPYVPSDIRIKLGSNLSNLSLENGMGIIYH